MQKRDALVVILYLSLFFSSSSFLFTCVPFFADVCSFSNSCKLFCLFLFSLNPVLVSPCCLIPIVLLSLFSLGFLSQFLAPLSRTLSSSFVFTSFVVVVPEMVFTTWPSLATISTEVCFIAPRVLCNIEHDLIGR